MREIRLEILFITMIIFEVLFTRPFDIVITEFFNFHYAPFLLNLYLHKFFSNSIKSETSPFNPLKSNDFSAVLLPV